MFSPKLKNYC